MLRPIQASRLSDCCGAISFPPKSAFGFLSTVPFWGANSQYRKKVRRQLLSRSYFKEEVENSWASCPLSLQETGAIRECIRRNIGWPNSLFLPTDTFLALAPLEIDRYDSFAADTDTVNDIYLILNSQEKERMKTDKTIGGMLVRSAVRCGDLPLMDCSVISPDHTLLDVLQIIQTEIRGNP